ncbi:MAG: hypothetical protein IH845_04775, partial [Nanoarchaeota archaeon]|nr:hypothetical protein [Nanoarchaeota archaeon]
GLDSQDISNPYKDLSHYLDYIDKPYNGFDQKNSNNDIKGLYGCHRGWIKGQCEGGHVYAKAVMCDKEWCPDCGKKNSNIHKRRISRWWDKIMPMKSVGYLVITIPEQFRNDFYNRDLLSSFRRYVIRKLKEDGFDKGLSRWHWAGSCTYCREKGCKRCNYTGMSDVWKPHLNILIENGYEPFVVDVDNWLNRYKEDIALQMCQLINKYRIIEKAKQYAKDLNCELEDINLRKINLSNDEQANINSIVLNYRYTDKEEKKVHLNNYVNRATWRYDYGFKEINTIKGYRTTQSWGKWKKTHERTSELVALEKGCCPECEKKKIKSKITWSTFESIKEGEFDYRFIKKNIEGGYYLLDLPPPVDIGFKELMNDLDYTGIFDKIFKGKYIINN